MHLCAKFATALQQLPLIAILRGLTPAEAPAIGEALVHSGFVLLEVPLRWETKLQLGGMITAMFSSPESLALWVCQTPNDVWCYDEKVYHYRNLGNALYRSFGSRPIKWRYALMERCLRLVIIAGHLDRMITGGRYLTRSGLARPVGRARL